MVTKPSSRPRLRLRLIETAPRLASDYGAIAGAASISECAGWISC
jgi:hypothetical protein